MAELNKVRPSSVAYNDMFNSTSSPISRLYDTDDETNATTSSSANCAAFLKGFDFSSIPDNAKITNISLTMKGRGSSSSVVTMSASLFKDHTGSSYKNGTDLGDGEKQFWKGTTLVTKTIDYPAAASACTVDFLKSGGLFVRLFQNSGAHRVFAVYLNVTYEMPSVTYTYVNYDGTVLKTQTVEPGASPTAPNDPTRPDTAECTYTFSGWSLSGTTYTAQYTATKRKYTVRWYNEDGTLLETDTTEYGVMPTYDGTAPTKAATAQYTYTFKGWHIEVTTVAGAIDYYARYTETTNKYTVLWTNEDGAVLEIDTTEYGKIPTYDGATPTKPSTAQHSYTFFGWDTTIEEVTRDVVYIAVYTQTVNKYTLQTEATEGGTVTGGGLYEYGASVTLTAIPDNGYNFVSWTDGSTEESRTVTVTGNATYTAQFEKNGVNNIFIGKKQPKEIYIGKKKVTAVYCGTKLIYKA